MKCPLCGTHLSNDLEDHQCFAGDPQAEAAAKEFWDIFNQRQVQTEIYEGIGQ